MVLLFFRIVLNFCKTRFSQQRAMFQGVQTGFVKQSCLPRNKSSHCEIAIHLAVATLNEMMRTAACLATWCLPVA